MSSEQPQSRYVSLDEGIDELLRKFLLVLEPNWYDPAHRQSDNSAIEAAWGKLKKLEFLARFCDFVDSAAGPAPLSSLYGFK